MQSNIFNWVTKLQHFIYQLRNILWRWELDLFNSLFKLCNIYFWNFSLKVHFKSSIIRYLDVYHNSEIIVLKLSDNSAWAHANAIVFFFFCMTIVKSQVVGMFSVQLVIKQISMYAFSLKLQYYTNDAVIHYFSHPNCSMISKTEMKQIFVCQTPT